MSSEKRFSLQSFNLNSNGSFWLHLIDKRFINPLCLLNYYCDIVEIFHEGELVISAYIKLNVTTGVCEFNIGNKSGKMHKIVSSNRRYIPFTFRFNRKYDMEGLVANVVKQTSLIVVGYICKQGFLCGYVKKFGMRTDTFIKLDLILGFYNFSYF